MRNKKLKLSTVILLCIGVTGLEAQQVVTTSGGNASGAGGTVSYSVGQIVYSTNVNSNGSVAHGVQQPYEISVVTGFEEVRDISLEIVVYPNPAQDFIKLMIKNYEVQDLSYQLYDINGSVLQDNRVESNEIQLSLQNLKPSAYILKVIQCKKEIKTFKIIKN